MLFTKMAGIAAASYAAFVTGSASARLWHQCRVANVAPRLMLLVDPHNERQAHLRLVPRRANLLTNDGGNGGLYLRSAFLTGATPRQQADIDDDLQQQQQQQQRPPPLTTPPMLRLTDALALPASTGLSLVRVRTINDGDIHGPRWLASSWDSYDCHMDAPLATYRLLDTADGAAADLPERDSMHMHPHIAARADLAAAHWCRNGTMLHCRASAFRNGGFRLPITWCYFHVALCDLGVGGRH